MKKFLLVFLSLLMALCVVLAACGKTPEEEPPAEELTGEYAVDMKISENPNKFTEYTLERGANEKQVVLYWREADHDYSDNDVWLWYEGKEGEIYAFHECSYGAKVVVNVPSSITQVGFIIRKDSSVHSGSSWGDCSKVYESDRYVTLKGDVTEVYFTGKNAHQFVSTNGGKTLSIEKIIAKMTISDLKKISYRVTPNAKLTDISDVSVKASDGSAVEVESLSQLNKSVPSGEIVLKSELDLTKTYTVSIKGFGEKTALPMEVFDSDRFVELYTYDGNDLGATVDGNNTVFKVWAPTAASVKLNLFAAGDGGSASGVYDMVKGDKGVWSYTAQNVGHGTYYTYSVTTAAGTQEAVDPYAKSAGVNGQRGMVVDFSRTDPDGFLSEKYVSLKSYTDAVIWETHVRDFSNNIAGSQYKGKYLAFTETGLTNSHGLPVGVDYVKQLGVTHLHLLPVFDFKSVDETNGSQFNWGYDPQNYNVLEGSYSTNPRDGSVRINEFKRMVQALHAQGLGVIMDVVYNHTYDVNSNLNKVVPNYYYRYNDDGTVSSGSGCGNDTASERKMFSKYMVDSVSFWIKEYKLDGFRFDLMGLHDVNTMQAIEKAVHAINPNAIIYGEGWTMTTTTRATLATQQNINRITATEGAAGSIAVFNDTLRDGLRGSVFDAKEAGYLGIPTDYRPKVQFGLIGSEKSVTGSGAGWTVKKGNVINYISAHDNNTLWDKLAISCQNKSEADRLAMNRIGATIVMVSKGVPFMQAGEEILRTKKNADGSFNDNSYNASDAVNNIKWEDLTPESKEYKMFLYYKGLIAMRKASAVLTAEQDVDISVKVESATSQIIAVFEGQQGKVAAVFNPTNKDYTYALPEGNWSLVCNGEQAGAQEIAAASGSVTVKAMSAHVYFSK